MNRLFNRQLSISIWLFFAIAALFLFLAAHPISAQEPPTTGSLTIIQDTNPESNGPEFDYDFDAGSDFDLEDDQSVTKTLTPGTYEIQQEAEAGWILERIYCDGDVIYSIRIDLSYVQVEVRAGDVIRCTFVNVPLPAPTPTPTATPVPVVPTPEVVFVPQVIFVQPPPAPIAPVAAIAPVATARPSVVRPPSTGDGGIK